MTDNERASAMEYAYSEIVYHARRLVEATNADDAYDAKTDLEVSASKLDALLSLPETAAA
jgi:hypothetical protein